MTARAASRVGKLKTINCRVTLQNHKMLEDAASAAGRSLSREIERRLELSFDWEAMLNGLRAAHSFRSILNGNPLSGGLWTGDLKDWPGNAEKDPT